MKTSKGKSEEKNMFLPRRHQGERFIFWYANLTISSIPLEKKAHFHLLTFESLQSLFEDIRSQRQINPVSKSRVSAPLNRNPELHPALTPRSLTSSSPHTSPFSRLLHIQHNTTSIMSSAACIFCRIVKGSSLSLLPLLFAQLELEQADNKLQATSPLSSSSNQTKSSRSLILIRFREAMLYASIHLNHPPPNCSNTWWKKGKKGEERSKLTWRLAVSDSKTPRREVDGYSWWFFIRNSGTSPYCHSNSNYTQDMSS
jgi:hypothetical protein